MDVYVKRQVEANVHQLYCDVVASAIEDYKELVSSKRNPGKERYQDGKSAYQFLNTDDAILGERTGKEILNKIHENRKLRSFQEIEEIYLKKEKEKEKKKMLEAKAKAYSVEARAMRDYDRYVKKAVKSSKLAAQVSIVNEMYQYFLNTENYISKYDFMVNVINIKGNMFEELLKNAVSSKTLEIGLRKAAAKAAGDKTSVSKRYASLPALVF